MAKDPAFLFYSNDFYEGTRMMLPEERACYIDLMIYQHQHGIIPNDLKRVKMYCSGIDEATLEATLEAKFKLCDKGWYNEKLKNIIEQRVEFSEKQSDNGILGQFFKKSKSLLKLSKYNDLKRFIYQEYGKENVINQLKNNEATHEAMLEALLKHLENENENENENKDLNNNSKSSKSKYYYDDEKFILPDGKECLWEHVWIHVQSLPEFKGKVAMLKFPIKSKIQGWIDSGWKDGHGKQIKNFKSKLNNSLPFMKPLDEKQVQQTLVHPSHKTYTPIG